MEADGPGSGPLAGTAAAGVAGVAGVASPGVEAPPATVWAGVAPGEAPDWVPGDGWAPWRLSGRAIRGGGCPA